MIVYDKEQKEIVIPNGIGNINLFNNGVEAGYNQGYEQGQADMAAKARVLEVTENGVYRSKFSDPIPPTLVTGEYADGTKFYNYAELTNKVFNTKIAATENSRLEFWYKGDGIVSGDGWNVIIGAGNNYEENCFEVRYFSDINYVLKINLGSDNILLQRWDDTVWHHLIISKAGGLWVDGKKEGYFSPTTNTINGEFFINGIGYNVIGSVGLRRNANGYFGMIKIDDTIIIPTADGFLNTNTGELLEVVKNGAYTYTENPPTYAEGELYKTINVNVPDLNGSYDEGYAQGKTDGINEQKAKLESINITENGTYRKEDGYNEVVVNVADLNGSYDEGYAQGQADVAANARVLEVTENGNYLSKFSDPIIPANVTGVYADGTNFYSYAELNGKVFNTNIPATKDSRIEFWWKNDGSYVRLGAIIGAQADNIFKIVEESTNKYHIEYGYPSGGSFFEYNFTYDMTSKWNHIIFSKQDGLNVNGELICEIQGEGWRENATTSNFWINAPFLGEIDNNANGYFGMIKINDVVFIPTANGFQNVNTGELLEVVKDGGYSFIENLPIYGEGELYKTINVNVIPKVNVKEAGLRLGYSKFTEVPDWADFEGATDMSNMFSNCESIKTIPAINTSNVTNMNRMFGWCYSLQTIPLLDTSKVTDASNMFYSCSNLITLPNNFNFSSCTTFSEMFFYAGLTDYSFLETWVINPNASMDSMIENTNTTYVPAIPCVGNGGYQQSAIFWAYGDYSKLTYFGGWIGRKYNITQDYILKKMTALSYESCISILNNLYDFTGNGETPNSEQGQLKVAQSFIDTVGDEISIATSKGWVVSV